MSEHRYSRAAIRGDFIRAGAGSALTLGPLVLAPASTIVSVILGGLTLLFVGFGVRTWIRQKSHILADEENLVVSGMGVKKIAWQDISAVELRYYTTKRDRSRGWMQLTLTAGDTKVRLESTLDRFERIAELAAGAARLEGLTLTQTTLENLRALGISTSKEKGWTKAPPAGVPVDSQ